MKARATLAVAAMVVGSGIMHAAEGIGPDWADIAPEDQNLMGDYEGEWVDAPKGHYFQINPTVAAQIINVNKGVYRIRFFQEHDRRADPYFEGDARTDGGAIVFENEGWSGKADATGLHGTARHGNKDVKFVLKRVRREAPTMGAKPPQGGIVLFDGSGLGEWQHGDGRDATWLVLDNGAMQVRAPRTKEEREQKLGGDIQTRRKFGDCRVHLEFRYPVEPGKAGQGRGNSGFFLQGSYEVQVLNSYGLHGYWNECGALYKLIGPKVNAARPPLEWQTYDVEYRAPKVEGGKKVKDGVISVWHNGVLIHHEQELWHGTAHAFASRSEVPSGPGPLKLQDHGNAIQYRNIWVVPLDEAK